MLYLGVKHSDMKKILLVLLLISGSIYSQSLQTDGLFLYEDIKTFIIHYPGCEKIDSKICMAVLADGESVYSCNSCTTCNAKPHYTGVVVADTRTGVCQCSATTQLNQRCKRKTTNYNCKCYQHQ